MSAHNCSQEPAVHANLRLLLYARAMSCSNVYTLFWVLYLIQDLHAPLFRALQVVSLGTILGGLLEVPTGWLADMFGRKLSLIVGAICCISGLAMYATANSVGLWLLAGITISQTGWSLSSGADIALADEICGTHSASFNWYAKKSVTVRSISQSAGALLGGLVFLVSGLHATLWSQVAVYTAMLVIVICIKAPPKREDKAVRHLGHIAWTLRREYRLLWVIIFGGVLSSLTGVAIWIAPLYYAQIQVGSEHLSLTWYAVLWASYVASPVLFGTLLRDRITQRLRYYGSLALLVAVGAATLLLLGATTSLVGLAAIFSFWFVRAIADPVLTVRIRALAPRKEELATILSIYRLVVLGMIGLFVWTVSWIAGNYSLSIGLTVLGLLIAVVGSIALIGIAISDRRASNWVSSANAIQMNPAPIAPKSLETIQS